MKLKSTAIICALNEESTIRELLINVCNIHLFNEIIVVNDGSTDSTGNIIEECAKKYPIRPIHFSINQGKGRAMAEATIRAKNPYLVFIDADISNFSTKHALQLITPLVEENTDMVIGIPGKTQIPVRINPFRMLSGERAVRKKDVEILLEQMHTSGYGVETLLNHHFKKQGGKIQMVTLTELSHPNKFQKTPFHKAAYELFKEGWQIIITRINLPKEYNLTINQVHQINNN